MSKPHLWSKIIQIQDSNEEDLHVAQTTVLWHRYNTAGCDVIATTNKVAYSKVWQRGVALRHSILW